jgi:hypothetical protein
MTARRWMGAAAAALVLAAAPGALQLIPDHHDPARARPMTLGLPDATALAPTPGPPPVEVPIIPPDDGLAGELAPAVPAPVPFASAAPDGTGEVYALIVGVNDYPGGRSDLAAAVADADAVDAALAGFGVPAGNRLVLRDGQARRADLVAGIQALVATAGPGSTVVLAYAGHVRKLDRDTEAIVAADGGLLRDDELAALLAPSLASRMWILLATCYAGGFTEVLGPGRILTAAADANSLAYESPSIHGSYLVHHLVQEGWLEGRAGPSVQEAFAYADARISEQYPERRPLQYDESGALMRFGTGNPAQTWSQGQPTSSPQAPPPPSGSPTPASPPPPSPTTTEPPERTCSLIVLCHRG